ncbi:MAG: hypothetical protein NZ869_03010 [Thermoanaerobaculum sp.]|nr:hypothetical protein [Thermoanaerobaculum sp.]MDW7967256.1 hypothetical protein [Thermoanaerobaculum sp.]
MSTFDSAPTVRVKPTLPAAAVRRGPGLAARFSLTTAAVVAVSLFVTVVILTRTANRVALTTVRSDLQRVTAIFSYWSVDAQMPFRSQVRSMAAEPGSKALLDPGVSAQTRYEFVARDAPLVLEAKTVFLFDREGKVLARNDLALGEGLGQPFGGVAWVAEPLSSWQEASAVIREKDTLSFEAAAPVVAGSGELAILDGVLAASFPLDEQAAQSLQTLTRGEVSFVVDRARAGQPTRAELSHATPGYPRAAFSDFMDRHPALVEAVFRRGEAFGLFSLGSTNGTFLALTIPIKGTTGEAYGALAVLRPL